MDDTKKSTDTPVADDVSSVKLPGEEEKPTEAAAPAGPASSTEPAAPVAGTPSAPTDTTPPAAPTDTTPPAAGAPAEEKPEDKPAV